MAIINLGILLFISRYLGSVAVGSMSLLVLNLAIVHTICEVYTGSALVYFIPRMSLNKAYTIGIAWIGACVIVVNAVLFFAGAGLQEFWVQVTALSFISGIHLFNNVILLAKEKVKLYNFLIFFQPGLLITALVIAVLALGKQSIDAYVGALFVAYFISCTISSFSVRKVIQETDSDDGSVKIRDILCNGFINQLGNLAHTLSNRYNFYVLELYSLALVGVYASGSSLIEQSLWMLSAGISPIILTHIANQRNPENNVLLTLLLAKICFVVSVICIAILFLIPPEFFTWLFGGKDFSQLKMIMLWLSPGVVAVSFSSIISHYFSGLGNQKILLWANSAGLLITVCTSYYFISRYGLKGACFSATLSYLMQSLVLVIAFFRKNNLNFLTLFTLGNEIRGFRKRKSA